jgi:hypothetical protein
MKAIVLTFDKNRAITEHMIARYETVWPGNPIVFHIPYQDHVGAESHNTKYVATPPDIKSTVLGLLRDIDDEEWVYWCIDDKYPINFNVEIVNRISQWITTITDTEISGILFCRCRRMLEPDYLTGLSITDDSGLVYLERQGYEQIWIHQFVRAKVIRHLFNSFPDVISYANIMDQYKDALRKPAGHRLFVSQQNHSVFGESMTDGALTQNCFESIKRNNLALPDWSSSLAVSSTMGDL